MRKPPNERARLARLHGLEILDSGPEPAFDELVSIAAQLLDAPMALISLVDAERQWFKASKGFPFSSTERAVAFCSETILSDSPLIVEDASKDPRFASSPLVTSQPQVRFYAGAPLLTEDNFAIGSLCVLDSKPRPISPAQLQALSALARQATAQIELRHKLLALKSEIDSLGDSERRFRQIADASPILMWISDQAGNRTFFNSTWCEFTGLSREQSIADSWRDVVHPDDLEVYDHTWRVATSKAEKFQREVRLRHASGSYRWVLEQAMPIFSSAGRLDAYVASAVDLSSRNEIELSYQKNEARFRAVSEAAPLGIFVTDSAGNFVYTNNQFQRISGQSVDESLGSGWLRAIPDDDRERVAKNWYIALQSTAPFEETFRYHRANGTEVWCSVKAATINSTDTVSGWVGTVEDITERRRANAEIVAAKQAAEAAMHAKSQFLANMSHEIRTPLTAIIGFAESLREELEASPEQLHTTEIILSNSQHLLTIINEILDLSKIDAGALSIEKTSFSLVRLVEEVRTMFAPRIAEKTISFSVLYEWPLPEHIITDPLRLKQVLINLLSNAIKFTERGWIEVRVRFDQSTGQIGFSVADSGIGIEPSKMGSLFQPFFQANESVTRQYGGTGLGLSISRRLVQALGGDISVQSSPGAGSSFSFWIAPEIGTNESLIQDIPTEQEPLKKSETPATFSGRVLFADDALDNRRLVHHLLAKAGISPKLVEDGKQAIDAVMTDSFDLILLDVQMPNIDGLSAARLIRRAGVKTPIVALSAGAMTSDVLKAIEAGCSMHLSKPFTKESFLSMLSRFLPANGSSTSGVGTRVEAIHSKRIDGDDEMIPLVVEFIDKLPGKVSEMSEALGACDTSRLAALAHRLRGSAGLYGYPELCELCGQLEADSKASDSSSLPSIMEGIEAMIRKIEAGKPTQ